MIISLPYPLRGDINPDPMVPETMPAVNPFRI
jgi:hypothetical protein